MFTNGWPQKRRKEENPARGGKLKGGAGRNGITENRREVANGKSK